MKTCSTLPYLNFDVNKLFIWFYLSMSQRNSNSKLQGTWFDFFNLLFINWCKEILSLSFQIGVVFEKGYMAICLLCIICFLSCFCVWQEIVPCHFCLIIFFFDVREQSDTPNKSCIFRKKNKILRMKHWGTFYNLLPSI